LDDPDDAEAAAARLAEEAAAAKAAADAEEAAVAAAADATAEAVVPASNAGAVAPEALVAPTEPKPAMDFEAERKKVEDRYNEQELSPLELVNENRRIDKSERDFERAQDLYNRDKDYYDQAVADRQQKTTLDWNAAALAFERDNKDFLSNPMRHADMERAIGIVANEARAKGEQLTPVAILDRAAKAAKDYSGYKDTAPAAGSKPLKDEIDARRPSKPARTLGDVPAAAGEAINDANNPYTAIDKMPIEAAEEAVANMTPAETERFLRSSEGSNSRGRGVDPNEDDDN
jgi:uncharacterized protein YkwD